LASEELNLDDMKELLQKVGFDEVRTGGGWVPIRTWSPYGGYKKTKFKLYAELSTVYDVVPAGEVAGKWSVR
jgi:hypothetical protein